MARRITRLAVMDFRFLAALGMTGRQGRIVAASPFCLPLSSAAGGEIVGSLSGLRQAQAERTSKEPTVTEISTWPHARGITLLRANGSAL